MISDLLIYGENILYIRKPFLIYDFAPDSIWISLYKRKILFSFLSVYSSLSPPSIVFLCHCMRRWSSWCSPSRGDLLSPKYKMNLLSSSLLVFLLIDYTFPKERVRKLESTMEIKMYIMLLLFVQKWRPRSLSHYLCFSLLFSQLGKNGATAFQQNTFITNKCLAVVNCHIFCKTFFFQRYELLWMNDYGMCKLFEIRDSCLHKKLN